MKTVSLVALFAIALASGASDAQDLEPCDAQALVGYDAAVDAIIDKTVGSAASLSVTTIPSFKPESGLRLVGPSVYFVQFQTSLWDQGIRHDGEAIEEVEFSSLPIRARARSAAIAPALAKRIEAVYAKAIAAARASERGGMDGETVRFSIPGIGCGSIWSPEPGTRGAQLVELQQQLARHVHLSTDDDQPRSEEMIAHLVQALEDR